MPRCWRRRSGIEVPADTELLFGETDESHPFVDHEQMMPFVPFVRVPDVDTAIALAKKYEHGFKHTSIIHSRNVETITRMGREMDTTLFVQNGPSIGGPGQRRRGLSELQHRHADGRRRDDAVDVHPATAIDDGPRDAGHLNEDEDSMQLAQVVGHAVSSVKHASLHGWRLLVVQPLTPAGKEDGEPLLAIDNLGSRSRR